jgi:hypothetical protein
MCTNQKWVDWDFMSKYEPLQGLLFKVEEARLKKIMIFYHNWKSWFDSSTPH